MKRRQFIAGLGSAAAWPVAAWAQQTDRMLRIGALMSVEGPPGQVRVLAFAEELEKLGWIEGRNISIDYRWAADTDRLRACATELVGMTPDVLLAGGGAPLVALQKATQTIPIVFERWPTRSPTVSSRALHGQVPTSPALHHTSKPSV